MKSKKGLAHMQLKKCLFQQEKVKYLGHCITMDGIFPTMAKVRSIKEAPVPKDEQSRPFLGLLKIVHKSSHPNTPSWRWQQTKAHQNAFDSVKELLTLPKVLTLTAKRKLSWHVMHLFMEPEQFWLIHFGMAVNTQWHLCHEH